MSGETSAIAEIANKVSTEIFKWFKWERIPLMDQNFDCVKSDKHTISKKGKHTHPVDVVFKYNDPYLDHPVFLNTDLKSYKTDSITGGSIRSALKSLAQTIECARISEEWKSRYDLKSEQGEIRGLLFAYNHDGEYDREFSKYFIPVKARKTKKEEADEKGVRVESLPLEAGQLIHIIEPRTIAYMTTIIADVHRMHAEGTFPKTSYFFFYSELKLHRTRGEKFQRPATVEMICGPFLIVGHDAVSNYDEKSKEVVQTFPEGFVVFYNRPGASSYEFMYLFDVLSSHQILDERKMRIRVIHHSPDPNIRSNFYKARDMYVHDWGFDDYKKEILESIDLEIVEIQKTVFSQIEIGWKRKGGQEVDE